MTAPAPATRPQLMPGGFANAYPADIRPLTSLRFLAAMWVLLFFFGERLGLDWREASGFVAKGYLGVDLFFILSGFILAHVYGPQLIAGSFNYGSFLWARIARIYPVHLMTLIILVGLAIVAGAVGLEVNAAFDFGTLWAQALLVHGWGLVPGGGWNHPSWSISAEWFAYLLFPLLFATASLFSRRVWWGVAGSAGVFVGLWIVAPHFPFSNGADLTAFTAFGAIRIVPSFVMGVALWRLGQSVTLPAQAAWIVAGISAVAVVVASEMRLADPLIWLALVTMIFGLAEASKSGTGGLLALPAALWLGEASYALYMIHMPVDLVWFQALGRFLSAEQLQVWAAALVIAAILLSILVAGLMYTLIEKPARGWLRARDPFKGTAHE